MSPFTTSEEPRRIPVTFLIGIVIVVLLIAGVVVWSRYSGPSVPEAEQPVPMGSDEQAYAPQIRFGEPKMGRAANFLNQEVTFIFGTVGNGGKKKIKQIEITLEFHDPFNQVVLRDKQRLFLPHAIPMAPGEQRDFQVGYEHVSAQWNNVYPTVRVSGILFD